MVIFINPGAGDIEDHGFEQAYKKIQKFIEDCEIPLYIEKANFQSEENGRYSFTIKSPIKHDLSWEVEMPSLSIEQVRYIYEEGQNIGDFPRLYVNGNSWVWKYGTIKKNHLIADFKYKIEDYQGEIMGL